MPRTKCSFGGCSKFALFLCLRPVAQIFRRTLSPDRRCNSRENLIPPRFRTLSVLFYLAEIVGCLERGRSHSLQSYPPFSVRSFRSSLWCRMDALVSFPLSTRFGV